MCDSCLQYSNYGFHYSLCRKKRHNILSLKKAYRTKHQQYRETISTIRHDALFYRPILLQGIKTDYETCHTKFSFYQSNMLRKSQTIKSHIDNVFRPVDFIHKYLKSNISIIHKYMLIYEQSPSAVKYEQSPSAVKFLLSIKKIKTKDVMDLLSDIQIKNGGYRSMRKEKILKRLPSLGQSDRSCYLSSHFLPSIRPGLGQR